MMGPRAHVSTFFDPHQQRSMLRFRIASKAYAKLQSSLGRQTCPATRDSRPLTSWIARSRAMGSQRRAKNATRPANRTRRWIGRRCSPLDGCIAIRTVRSCPTLWCQRTSRPWSERSNARSALSSGSLGFHGAVKTLWGLAFDAAHDVWTRRVASRLVSASSRNRTRATR